MLVPPISHQQKILSNIFPAVNAPQVAMHYRQKLTYDASHHVIKDNASILIGTMVMLRDELRSNHNDSPYLCPYRIIGRNIRGLAIWLILLEELTVATFLLIT